MNKKLLIVDDEENILKSLQRFFYLEGYEIFIANSGKEGLEILSQQQIPVIISDQRMPNMSGSEFMTKVKELYPETIRIILSGYADFSSITDAINNGEIYKFLTKPWDDKILLDNIQKAFEVYEKSQKNNQAYYIQQVCSDVLTGLVNRETFIEYLSKHIKEAEKQQSQFYLCIIDLNRFKNINNVLGYRTGDLALKAVAERLKKFSAQGELIARLGNDEFAMMTPNIVRYINYDDYFNALLDVFKEPFNFENQELHLSISIGVTIYPEDGKTASILLQHTNIALHHAQKLQINYYHRYLPVFKMEMKNKLELENDIKKAITNKHFRLFYQPLWDIEKNQLSGLEALIRWFHPSLGLIMPRQFISLAEKNDFITDIEKQTLEMACKFMHHLEHNMDLVVKVNLNMSTREFSKPGIIKIINQIVEKYSIKPENLELEVTESLLINNIKQCQFILNEIREMGIQLALDDFGTGYSSLNYLTQFPFNTIKIDKTFIRKAIEDKRTEIVLLSVLQLCERLNLNTIIEGVETEEQASLIKNYPCHIIQGYWVSPPLPEEDLIDFLMLNSSQGISSSH